MIRRTVNEVLVEVPEIEKKEKSRYIHLYKRTSVKYDYIGSIKCDSPRTLEKFKLFLEGIPDEDNS